MQDVLPTLPNPDDYFLLRWLRGEGRGGGDQGEGQREGPGPNCFRRTHGSQDPITPSCFTCSDPGEGRVQGRKVLPRPPVPCIAPHTPGPGQSDYKAASLLPHTFLPSSHSSEFRPAEIRGHAPQGETCPLLEIWEGFCGGQSTPRAPISIPFLDVLGAQRGLTSPLPFSTWSSGSPWTLTTSLIGSPQR